MPFSPLEQRGVPPDRQGPGRPGPEVAPIGTGHADP